MKYQRESRGSRDPEAQALAIDETWVPIEMALNRNDPLKAIDLYDAAVSRMKTALLFRMEDYLKARLALPRDDKHQFDDDQGLARLIYMVWPVLPVQPFYPSMLPVLFDAIPEYKRRFPWSSVKADDLPAVTKAIDDEARE